MTVHPTLLASILSDGAHCIWPMHETTAETHFFNYGTAAGGYNGNPTSQMQSGKNMGAPFGSYPSQLNDDQTNDYATFPMISGSGYAFCGGAWIKTTSTDGTANYAGDSALTILGDTSGAVAQSFGVHGGKVRYARYSGSWQTLDSVTSVNDGQWHYIAFSCESGSNNTKVFVDGVVDNTATFTMTGTVGFNCLTSGYASGDNYVGSLAFVWLKYGTGISNERVLAHYNTGKPVQRNANGTLIRQVLADSPLLYWPFDEDTDGATCRDISGNGRDGTDNGTGATLGAASVVPGFPYSELSSGSGASGYWSRADEAAFQVGTGDFTYECWMICSNTTSNYVQIFGRDVGASGGGQMLYLDTGSGYARCYCAGAVIFGTTRLSDGLLHHVVFRRISGTATIWVDGIQQGSLSAAGSVITSALRVNAINGEYASFAGRMAHFAYYATGLSDARIKAHYQAGIRGGASY